MGEREKAPHFLSPNLLKRSPSFPKTFEPIVPLPASLKTDSLCGKGNCGKKREDAEAPSRFSSGKAGNRVFYRVGGTSDGRPNESKRRTL